MSALLSFSTAVTPFWFILHWSRQNIGHVIGQTTDRFPFCSEGTTKGVSISGTISGTDADSESLRLLRPTLLSLAGYFNTTAVSQEAVQLLQVSVE